MKKIIALILAVLMLVAMVACGETNEDVNDTNDGTTETPATDAPVAEPAKAPEELLNGMVGRFCEILSPLFEAPAEDVKHAFAGGYFSDDETTIKSGEAGRTPIDVEDAVATLKTASLISDEAFAKLDDAAIFHHMMNMNTLSVSALRVANAADLDSVANAMRESVGGNQIWMCGFPERYLVITVDTCVISAYGNADMVNAIKTAVVETYDNAVVVCDEAFA